MVNVLGGDFPAQNTSRGFSQPDVDTFSIKINTDLFSSFREQSTLMDITLQLTETNNRLPILYI